MENRELMANARKSLEGKWGLAIGTFLVYWLIVAGASNIPFAMLVIGGAMHIGISIFSLNYARNQKADLEQIFDGFKVNFGRSIIAHLLKVIFVFLWTLLLIIPGIIKAIAYSQVYYILSEDKSISASDALIKSRKMMYGNKWKYFCLKLRFIGWWILSVWSLGIGFLWLAPYIKISCANFYDDIKTS
ncbi:MAG: DUF975 family protein [Candidatus Marinimicrobia bacterium]|nr:DUF975 family protein [Candidatus Neomarinimicrobiota bacterium]